MDDHVDEPRDRVGGSRANPLFYQCQGVGQLQFGAWQQVDDQSAAEAGSQRPVEPFLKQQQRVAILTE